MLRIGADTEGGAAPPRIGGGGLLRALLDHEGGALLRSLADRDGTALLRAFSDRDGSALLQALADRDGDGILALGPDATLAFASAGALRLLGAEDAAGLIGRAWRDLWPEPHRAAAEAALAAARGGAPGRFQAAPVADGDPRRCDVAVSPIRNSAGDPVGFAAVLRDVAGVTAADRAAPAPGTGALLREAVEAMDQGLMLIDADERVPVCNRRAVELLDLPADLMAANPAFDAVRRHQLATGEFTRAGEDILALARRAGLNAAPRVYERERPNGTVLEIRTAALPGGGVVRTYTDVTERRRAEREVEAREERYRLAARATNDAIWDWDLGTGRVERNDAVLALFGYADPAIEPNLPWWEERLHPDDRARVMASIAAYLEGSVPQWRSEYRFRRADGSYADVLDRAYLMRDGTGRPIRMVGAMQDLTPWRQAESQARRLARQLNDILESTTDAVGFVGRDWRITYVNGRARREFPEGRDLVGAGLWEAFPEADDSAFAALCRDTMAGGAGGSVEGYNTRLRRWYDLTVYPSADGIAVFFRNITEQRRAREALRRSEQLLQSALSAGRIVAWQWDLATGYVQRSANSEAVLGFGSGPSAAFVDRVHPDDRPRLEEAWKQAVAEGGFQMELRLRRPDGTWMWIDEQGRFEFASDGRPVRLVGLLADITARKEAEIEARDKAALLETTLEHMDQGLLVIGADRGIPLWNRRALELLGLPAALFEAGISIDDLVERQTQAGEFAEADADLRRAIAQGAHVDGPGTYERRRPNGTVLEVRTVRLGNGGAVRTYTDTTARHAAERLKAESERRYRLLAENATDMIVRAGVDGRPVYVSPACRDLLGYEPEEFLEKGLPLFVHPEDAATAGGRLMEMCAGVRDHDTVTYRARHRSGRWVWLEAHRRLLRDADGRPHEVIGVVRDVSERRRLEDQLRQAQKMEAVGQLTGGIAHDFNNLLTVILGNAEVLAEDLEPGPFKAMAQVIFEAADKGAGLTQQLLAFGRRQTLRAEPLRLPEVVEGMTPLLRRTLGEHIVLRTAFGQGRAPALADRTLLESAILNLAINARDAMPQGGVLEIGTDDVMIDAANALTGAKPGRYAALTVSDSGTGMAPEVLERAFEPFFTTKEVGRGSGLGLSMVYGFAQQSGGHVGIESRPGRGTAVTVLLPLAAEDAADLEDAPAVPPAHPARRTRILVVEDEADVRRFVTSLLLALGHEVVEAGTGQGGLQALRADPAVDLLFSDVVLPDGMSGVELARRARALRPDLKVLLTSGYPEDAFAAQGRPDPDTIVLQKPYRRRELAEAIRRVLDPEPLAETG
ncbi:MAG TPA: PAS domain S-box protein [Microvirga sp.]|jgi:PAS domain S-box-containing protein|nr:PAS domain S-box protein [Microvirga sp.]